MRNTKMYTIIVLKAYLLFFLDYQFFVLANFKEIDRKISLVSLDINQFITGVCRAIQSAHVCKKVGTIQSDMINYLTKSSIQQELNIEDIWNPQSNRKIALWNILILHCKLKILWKVVLKFNYNCTLGNSYLALKFFPIAF